MSANSASLSYSAPQVNKWIITLSIAFGSLMATIDSSIVNVAISYIRGSVGATVEEITWISTSYIIAMVLVMPLTGLLGALFGQKRLYLVSLFVFVIGSMLCGVARSLPALVFFRIIQGLGAGALQPSQQAIMRQTFPEEEQGMAMAIFSMGIMIGPAIGPTLGGWITDNLSWPWIFFINLPIGIVGIFMTWKNVHEPEDVRAANLARGETLRKNMDWLGIILMAVGISTLQYFLEEGPSKDWFESTQIIVCMFIATICLIAFVIRELSFSHPVVNLRLFRNPTFASASVVAAVAFAALMASMFLLPLFMQEVLGFNATQSGITLLPRILAMLVVTPFIGRMYNQIAPSLLIAFGAVTFIIGSFQLGSLTLQTGPVNLISPLLITGAGLAFLMIPLNTVALSSIERKDLADAAGLNSFIRQIGGSIGLTIFATLLDRYITQASADLMTHVTPLRYEVQNQLIPLSQQISARVHDTNLAQAMLVRLLNAKVMIQSRVLAFDKLFLLQGLLFFVILPLSFFLKVDRRKKVHIEISAE